MRKENKGEQSIFISALSMLLVTFLLMSALARNISQTVKQYNLNEMQSQPAIRIIETKEPSIYTEITLTAAWNGSVSGVYDNIPEMETASETAGMTVYDTEWVYPLTEEELELAALVAEKEDIDAMHEVAETILNRIKSGKFPNTVEEVVYQKKQFYAVNVITDEMEPCEEAIEAVTAVFRDGHSTVGEALFFAEKSIPPYKIAKGLYLIKTAGGTAFYGQGGAWQ